MSRALFFVNCINFFFCVLMYDIYILPISHLPIFLSHIYHCMKKKENENLQLKRCVWRMRREIITIQNKQFWRLFNYVMIKLFLFTTRECYLIYILSVTLWNIVHAFFNALDNWHHHMDFVKIPCDQCNPIPSYTNILYTIWDCLFFNYTVITLFFQYILIWRESLYMYIHVIIKTTFVNLHACIDEFGHHEKFLWYLVGFYFYKAQCLFLFKISGMFLSSIVWESAWALHKHSVIKWMVSRSL